MTPLDILSFVRRTPFEPFRLILIDGAKYDVIHADQCMVMKRELIIGSTGPGDQLIEWSIKVNCHNVVRIETLLAATCSTKQSDAPTTGTAGPREPVTS